MRQLGQTSSSRCPQTPGDGLLHTSRPSTSGFLLQDPFCIAGSIPLEEVWWSSGLDDLWMIFQCFNSVCWLSSCAMASINLSWSGCCIATLSGIALGYTSGCAMVDANARRLANGWKSKTDLIPVWAMVLQW